MVVKIKIPDSLQKIELGSYQDDAVYLHFLLGKGLVGNKLIAEIKADKKYICTLRGENDIINYKGEVISGAEKYLYYTKKGRMGKEMLNFNKKAYLYVENKDSNGPGLVFDSIADVKSYFENKFKNEETQVLV